MTSFHPVVFVDVCRMMHLSLNTSQSQGTGKHIRRLWESIYRTTSATLLAILLEQRFSLGQDTRKVHHLPEPAGYGPRRLPNRVYLPTRRPRLPRKTSLC